MKHAFSFAIAILLIKSCLAQQRQEVLDYIAKYKDIALEEMVRCKIPASITLAQGIHESNCGRSPLSSKANNHFGIKCKTEWEGKKFYMNDDAPNECFRVYEHAEASYADHSDFLVTRSRYEPLFELKITDYKAWANGLKAYGYATNPHYASILIKSIEDYNLAQYDKVGLAMIDKSQKLLNPIEPFSAPLVAKKETPKPEPKAEVKQTQVQVTPAPKPVVAVKEPAITHTTSTPIQTTATIATIPAPKTSEVKQPLSVKELIKDAPVVTAERKEVIVNGTRALKAIGNEDPLTIAFEYNIDYAHILSFNDLAEGERFKNAEYIYLQPKRIRGEQSTYTVQAGESMRDIAQKFGIRLRELYLKNQMAFNDQVYPGETISLQDKRSSAPKTMAYADFLKAQRTTSTAPITLPKSSNQYRVQQSDTLYSIAHKFNLSVDELKALNNLNGSDLQPGQDLVVSK